MNIVTYSKHNIIFYALNFSFSTCEFYFYFLDSLPNIVFSPSPPPFPSLSPPLNPLYPPLTPLTCNIFTC